MIIKKIAQLTGHNAAVFAIAAGKSPQYILSGAGEGWVVEWDLHNPETGRLVAKVARNIFSLIYLKEQNLIVAGDMDGGVRFVDLVDGSQTRNILHHGGKGCFDLKVIYNQLFTIGGDGYITRWSIPERRSLDGIQLSHKSLRCMDYSESRNEIAIGASDGAIYFLDAQNFEFKSMIEKAHHPSVFSIQYTPDGKNLLSGGRDALLKLWNLPNTVKRTPFGEGGEGVHNAQRTTHNLNLDPPITHHPSPITHIAAHLFTVNALVFHPTENNLFATASRDKTIKIWKIESDTEGGQNPKLILLKVINTIRNGCHVRSINCLFWSPFHNYLISASDDRSLMVWTIDDI